MSIRFLYRAPTEEKTYRVRSLFPPVEFREIRAGWERCAATKCRITLPREEMTDVDGHFYCHHHDDFAQVVSDRAHFARVAGIHAPIRRSWLGLALCAAGIALIFVPGGLIR